MRCTFQETQSRPKRNMVMAIAAIVTMSVSLSLLGVGLSTSMEVDLVKDRWYGEVEISVFLYVECNTEGIYEPRKIITDAQRKTIEETLKANPEVKEVFCESKEEALKELQRIPKGSPVLASRTVEQVQDSFYIKLLNPKNCKGMVSEAQGLQEVQSVRDLRSVFDPIFNTLGGLQWATIGMNVLLLLTAALQTPITIRMATLTRWREIDIMRLVGAPNFHILLPFLLESLIADLIGVLISSGSVAVTYLPLIEQITRSSIPTITWTDADHVFNAITYITVVGVALSVVPTLLVTRKYLRIWRTRRSRRIGLLLIYSKTPSPIESPAV